MREKKMGDRANLVAVASYLPEGRMSAEEIGGVSGLEPWIVHQKLGIKQKCLPGPDDHPTQMAIWAAQKVLKKSQLAAKDIDVVISIVEEFKEYPVWTAGIRLAHEIGALNAYAYDIGQKCGSSVLALKQAKDLILADDEINTVLVAGGYRNGDLIDFKDPDVRFMYNLAAGGGAAIVQRQSPKGLGHEILKSSILTDGALSLDVLVPVGGTKDRLAASNIDQFRLRVTDPAGMRSRLEAKSLDNFFQVIKSAVHKSGYQLKDIDYLAMLHMKPSAHEHILAELGLKPEKSIYLSDYGHIGQIDQLLSLELAEAAGKLKPGDLVVLVAAGVGYVWNALCLRW
ncbi:MAG: 3-oxoacyl-ACP synthase [Deinococcales bacterium]